MKQADWKNAHNAHKVYIKIIIPLSLFQIERKTHTELNIYFNLFK